MGVPSVDIARRKSRVVRVGDLLIGGDHPVVVQEMTTSAARDVERTVAEIGLLEKGGCRLVRVALPDEESARAVARIRERVHVPIVGDVHFNARIALQAIESGIDKLRLNPGNIGGSRGVESIARAARERGIPIRVGVNSGSLGREMLSRYGGPSSEALVESALLEVSLLERHGFGDIIISLKSSDVPTTLEANRLLASRVDYPLHIGVTEAGFGAQGAIRSEVGIGVLLMNGIGDTVRVSITSRERTENLALCFGVLRALGIPFV